MSKDYVMQEFMKEEYIMRNGRTSESDENVFYEKDSIVSEKDSIFNERDFLTREESDKKLIDSTLGEFRKARNYAGILEIMIGNFISYDCSFNMTVGVFEHNLLQYNLKDFFKKKGFNVVKEFNVNDDDVVTKPKKTTMQISEDEEYLSIYQEATLFLQKDKSDDKVVIVISKSYGRPEFIYNFYVKGNEDVHNEWLKFSKENNFYKNKKITANCEFLKLNKSLTWDDVILKDGIKQAIKRNIQDLINIQDILEINKILLKRGIILSGPPGTGKTMACKVLLNEINVTVLYVLPNNIQDKSDVSRICNMAKEMAPTLMVLEDIDYLAKDRDISDANDFLVVDLMNKLDGIEDFCGVITLATTNKKEQVEDALRNRPGRFDRVIEVGNPDEDLRFKMLSKFLENYHIEDDVDLKKISKDISDDRSGSFVKEVCNTAAFNAIYDKSLDDDKKVIIKMNHFEEALKELSDKDFSSFYEENFGFRN